MQRHMISGKYTLAGENLMGFEKIIVSRSVELSEEQQSADEDQRVVFRAPRSIAKRKGLSMPVTLLLALCTLAIMLMISGQKAGNVSRLETEVELLKNKYLAVESDYQAAERDYLEASDGSFISYYAAQKLGMKRAVHEETIQVWASTTRPQVQYVYASQPGIVSANSLPSR